ncbi:family 16 glycosylhydrolase [Pseudonocardia sp. Ae717_Ps2]|uniref:glycoside hydrolase family 16 protein n=1 Tax=Pseudonocardia sp. Ae717_Ps2 TaxID=1885573 RepID=UPI001179E25A|nr:glycoside hydrolase family 16 protein [Pseudonocardia sp. Ae717_Ps2]
MPSPEPWPTGRRARARRAGVTSGAEIAEATRGPSAAARGALPGPVSPVPRARGPVRADGTVAAASVGDGAERTVETRAVAARRSTGRHLAPDAVPGPRRGPRPPTAATAEVGGTAARPVPPRTSAEPTPTAQIPRAQIPTAQIPTAPAPTPPASTPVLRTSNARVPAAPGPITTTSRLRPTERGARATAARAGRPDRAGHPDRAVRPDRAVTGLRRRIAHGAGAMALVLVAAAGLTWTVLVPPDGTAGADPATSALDNQLPPPPPPPPPQQWRQVGGDEFDGSRVDRSTWTVYNSPGGFGNGLRRPSAVGVGDGLLTVTARPRAAGGGVSGGVAMHDGQLYGRWEFRARTDAGTGYSPAILLWPDSERFPDDGELDMMEIPFGARHAATAFVHYGAQNHILSTASPGDFTQWHTFALDWLPDRISWYVDGVKKWEVTDRRAIPTTPMHLAIQLDQGPASGWIPAPDASTPDEVRLQVDWARVFAPVDDAG